jgi:hypothetical protein
MKQQLAKAVKKNICWFRNSGIMRPNDGFWSVGERIVANISGEARKKIDFHFPCQSRLNDNILVLEQRRADCSVETAMLFDLASEYFNDGQYRQIAENIIDFLINRSGLLVTDPNSPLADLWEWAMPKVSTCWTDDNSWMVTGLLFLASRGYGEKLKFLALSTADALHKHGQELFEFIENNNKAKYPETSSTMLGLRLNPHWMGLVTMALALADQAKGTHTYYKLIKKYYAVVLDGPPLWDKESRCKTENGVDWSVSEYAYLALTGTIAAKVYNDKLIADVAVYAGELLLKGQHDDGHFISNHFEAPEGRQFADLIYTQNWATLALRHLAVYYPENSGWRKGYEKSAAFLVRIQDDSDSIFFNGCWRGMYDCEAGTWGGGDKYEGGQGSIYSGWTNAPISIAFLLELCAKSLLPDKSV